MQKHWKTVEWGALVALTLFIIAVMTGHYAVVYGVLVSSLMIGSAYLIAVAGFRNRQDPESSAKKREKHAH